MPTARPRIMVTESDELAAALDSAASRYPGLTRAQLLIRLVGRPLREHSGALTGAYGEHYLERLRQEWPA
jgi:hypothetical protein